MNQQHIIPQSEFQTPSTAKEEVYFDTQPDQVEEIPAAMPLDDTPTRTSVRRPRLQRLRVPMRRENKSFNPAFLALALLAVTALGVIAGTLVYRTTSEKSENGLSPENGMETRTVQPQYQFILDKQNTSNSPSTVGKTESSTMSLKNNPNETMPVVADDVRENESETTEKVSRSKQKLSDSNSVEEEEESVPTDSEIKDEKPAPNVNSDDDMDEPPPPPKNKDQRRKDNKKRDRSDENNSRSNSPIQEFDNVSNDGTN